MTSIWRREHKILDIPSDHPWWASHAQMPTVLVESDHNWRIFVVGRSAQNIPSQVVIDVDPSAGMRVVRVSQDILLPQGPEGQFDERGPGIASIVQTQNEHLFYTSGMKLGGPNPYANSIGLLKSTDGGRSFGPRRRHPVLGATKETPFGCDAGHVVRDGDNWRMWYAHWYDWEDGERVYDIRSATSRDGVSWNVAPQSCIQLERPSEYGFARPWVMATPEGYEMWYSKRGAHDKRSPFYAPYQLGYAKSADGDKWERCDAEHRYVNPPKKGDWDAEMQCYGTVVQAYGQSYMFYCGNEFGSHGLGYAVRVQ